MSEQGMFEQSVLEAIISAIESYEKNDLDGWELYLVKRRAELADKEKAELQAHINDLREALAKIKLDSTDTNSYRTADKALLKTPPQCLQEHDNDVIERCAKVVDESYAFDSDGFAKEIRALKGKQNETT